MVAGTALFLISVAIDKQRNVTTRFFRTRRLNEATPISITAERRGNNSFVRRSGNVWWHVPLRDGDVYAFPVRRLRNDKNGLGLARLIAGPASISALCSDHDSGNWSPPEGYCSAAYRCIACSRRIVCSARLLWIAQDVYARFPDSRDRNANWNMKSIRRSR